MSASAPEQHLQPLIWLLSHSASPIGLAENVHCDLQPVDPDRGEVTYITSQVSEGCVAQAPNAALEVHVLFLKFLNVSAPGRVRQQLRAMG